MSSTAAPGASLAEEMRDLAERLGAAEEKNEQLSEENRVLFASLTIVEEELVQRDRELATVEAKNGRLLQEKCDLAERLAKGKELMGALVATVPELAFLCDAGQSTATGSSSSSSSTQHSPGHSSGSPQLGGEFAEPVDQHEDAAVTTAPSEEPAEQTPPLGPLFSDHGSGSPQHGGELMPEPEDLQEEAATTAAPSAAPVQKTLPIGLLFPDAGQHYLKMMSGVKDLPAVKDMLEKAGAILGLDVLRLCLDELAEISDPMTYIAGLAGLEKLRHQREEAVLGAQVMAGMGVGEYAALTAAGVFSFEDGLKLVRLRFEAMAETAMAGGKQATATAWVSGLDKPRLAALCATAAKKAGSGAVCQIAVECFNLGFKVAGTEKAVLLLKDLAEKAGAVQARVQPWVPCASHTPLMTLAQERMSALLDELLPKMNPPRTTVYMNATAAPVRPGTSPKDVAEILKKELTFPLLWEPSVKAMIKEGVSQFYEVGPGEVLKGHMRRINGRVWRSMTSIKV